MQAALTLAPMVGVVAACAALMLARATFYRWQRPAASKAPRPSPPRALSSADRAEVLATLNSDRFADKAPRQVFAALLDEGRHLCSTRTMYRVLAAAGEVRERRDQLRHPTYAKPELLATAPNQVWSWDITKLKGPVKWTHFHLYVILDVFSRYVVGWMVAARESAELAQELIVEACARQRIQPGQLTVHADRGSPMKAKSTAMLYGDLGITKSHSRPYVSDDNPFSESQFKTLKYRPELPDRFGSLPDARALVAPLMHWYNEEHYHSGIALLTPADLHYGRAAAIIEARQRVLDAAYAAHPERFVRGVPVHQQPPTEVWINPPVKTTTATSAAAPPATPSALRGPQREAASPTETIAEPARARTAPRGHEPYDHPPMPARAEPRPPAREGAVLH
jgi:putative transposase